MNIIKMRYSIEPRDRISVKGYGFSSFAKNIGKKLNNKMQQKLLLKEEFKKTAEATGDLIGNKTVDKITSISKKSNKELSNNDEKEEDMEITTHKKRYITPEERQRIIDELS